MFFKCHHKWKITKVSNIICSDELGYPLQLCIEECRKCHRTKMSWIDVHHPDIFNSERNNYLLCQWAEV